MRRRLPDTFLTLVIVFFLLTKIHGQTRKNFGTDAVTIFPKGAKINNGNFTGTAYLQMLMAPDSVNSTAIGNVTFEPGSRTKWHSHAGGQILLVTDGIGYYQEKGQAKKILRRGDVIKCAANIVHWHGASADSYFVQIAVTNNSRGAVVWLGSVTDEEYLK